MFDKGAAGRDDGRFLADFPTARTRARQRHAATRRIRESKDLPFAPRAARDVVLKEKRQAL